MARTLDDVRAQFKSLNIDRVKLGFFDLHGVLRGLYVGLDSFPHLVQHGVDLSIILRGLPPDARGHIDLDTMRRIPWEPGTACFLMDLVHDDGSPHPACPRGLLRRVVHHASERKLRPQICTRLSFAVFHENREAARAKGFRNLTPITPAGADGAWLSSSEHHAFLHPLLDHLKAFEVSLDLIHAGAAPGVHVATLRPVGALDAADQAALFKIAVKELAHRDGMSATFMARHTEGRPRSTAQWLTSVWNPEQTENLCVGEHGALSPLAQHFLAGQIEHVPTFMPMLAPNTNSYGWQAEDLEQPAFSIQLPRAGQAIAGWHGVSTMVGSADANPYVAISAAIAMGLHGVERNLELSATVLRDGHLPRRHLDLPATLDEAVGRLRLSTVARSLFGAATVDQLVHAGREELDAARRAVSDHELLRHFEGA